MRMFDWEKNQEVHHQLSMSHHFQHSQQTYKFDTTRFVKDSTNKSPSKQKRKLQKKPRKQKHHNPPETKTDSSFTNVVKIEFPSK